MIFCQISHFSLLPHALSSLIIKRKEIRKKIIKTSCREYFQIELKKYKRTKSTHGGCLCFYKTIQYLDVRKIEYKVFYKQIDLYMTLHGGLKLAPSLKWNLKRPNLYVITI